MCKVPFSLGYFVIMLYYNINMNFKTLFKLHQYFKVPPNLSWNSENKSVLKMFAKTRKGISYKLFWTVKTHLLMVPLIQINIQVLDDFKKLFWKWRLKTHIEKKDRFIKYIPYERSFLNAENSNNGDNFLSFYYFCCLKYIRK